MAPVTQNCRGKGWQPLGPQHPAHGGEGGKELGQEDVSQGNKVIAVGASQGSSRQMAAPKGKTWDLMSFLLRK